MQNCYGKSHSTSNIAMPTDIEAITMAWPAFTCNYSETGSRCDVCWQTMNILIVNQSVIDMLASFFTLMTAAVEVDGTHMSRDSYHVTWQHLRPVRLSVLVDSSSALEFSCHLDLWNCPYCTGSLHRSHPSTVVQSKRSSQVCSLLLYVNECIYTQVRKLGSGGHAPTKIRDKNFRAIIM